MEKIAFIGMGNMAQALTGGFIKAGKIEPKNIFAYAPNQQKLAQNAAKYGFIPCASLKEAVSKADTIFMACKPYQIEDVISEVGRDFANKTLISIALGWNFHAFEKIFSAYTEKPRIQFVMPNTPAMVAKEYSFLKRQIRSNQKNARKSGSFLKILAQSKNCQTI